MSNSIVVITGAGSGIGRAAAQRMVTEHTVVAIGRTKAKLDGLREAGGERIIPYAMDVSARTEVERLVGYLRDQKATVAALVNAAGFALGGTTDTPLAELEDNWNKVIAANLTGTFLMCMGLAPLLKRPGGRIVNISSIAAYTGGRNAGSSIYAASKAGIHGLSAGLARELSPAGITVNTIAPGFIAGTDFTSRWPAARIDGIVAETPARRAGTPEEVAGLIQYLCSEAAGFITGEIISQNGGWRFGS
jgi:3-oxoacyl-[acyl-carrier protein] reductase